MHAADFTLIVLMESRKEIIAAAIPSINIIKVIIAHKMFLILYHLNLFSLTYKSIGNRYIRKSVPVPPKKANASIISG